MHWKPLLSSNGKRFGIVAILVMGICLFVTRLLAATVSPEVAFVQSAYRDLARLGSTKDPRAIQRVQALFDFDAFFANVSQDIASKLSPPQRDGFKTLFATVFFDTINRKGLKLDNRQPEKLRYSLSRKKKDEVVVRVNGVFEGKDVLFDFYIHKKNGKYAISDLAVHDALLSRNYRGPFNRIYREEGYEGLMQRLLKKQHP